MAMNKAAADTGLVSSGQFRTYRCGRQAKDYAVLHKCSSACSAKALSDVTEFELDGLIPLGEGQLGLSTSQDPHHVWCHPVVDLAALQQE